jgi:hypothetical protein
MGSKHKQSRMEQKASFERKLEDRLSYLSKKGIESPKIGKDIIVKKLRADINAVNTRLKWIADNEKKTEELAKIKAEKTAAPREDQEGGKDKKSKEAPAVGKEKAAAPKKDQKDQEDGKVKKSKEAPAEGKEKKKKKEDNNPEKSE